MNNMKTMSDSYIGAIEFTEHAELQGRPLPAAVKNKAIVDCLDFIVEAEKRVPTIDWAHPNIQQRAGQDFWFTRNGHGCGFWDGDWPEHEGEVLTNLSKEFGEVYIYVGDDGQVYSGGGK